MLLWESAIGHPDRIMTQINYSLSKSRFVAFVIMDDFSLHDINCEHHTADTNTSRRFLKHPDYSFLVQILKEMTRKGAILDLTLLKQRGPCGCTGDWRLRWPKRYSSLRSLAAEGNLPPKHQCCIWGELISRCFES